MAVPGLDNRLRQHTRRAGLMVGLSMAITIAVCIGSFAWIYAEVDPLTKDFVDVATSTATSTGDVASRGEEEPEPTEAAGDEADNEPRPTEPPDDEAPQPTPTSERFQPTHIVSAEVTINLRPGPAVSSGDPVAQLAPGTELQYLDESRESEDPLADGDARWLKFRTEDGLEGWIRQIDVDAVNAGQ